MNNSRKKKEEKSPPNSSNQAPVTLIPKNAQSSSNGICLIYVFLCITYTSIKLLKIEKHIYVILEFDAKNKLINKQKKKV